jgi:hypothetical protein
MPGDCLEVREREGKGKRVGSLVSEISDQGLRANRSDVARVQGKVGKSVTNKIKWTNNRNYLCSELDISGILWTCFGLCVYAWARN